MGARRLVRVATALIAALAVGLFVSLALSTSPVPRNEGTAISPSKADAIVLATLVQQCSARHLGASLCASVRHCVALGPSREVHCLSVGPSVGHRFGSVLLQPGRSAWTPFAP